MGLDPYYLAILVLHYRFIDPGLEKPRQQLYYRCGWAWICTGDYRGIVASPVSLLENGRIGRADRGSKRWILYTMSAVAAIGQQSAAKLHWSGG